MFTSQQVFGGTSRDDQFGQKLFLVLLILNFVDLGDRLDVSVVIKAFNVFVLIFSHLSSDLRLQIRFTPFNLSPGGFFILMR